jgi:FAD/FMN-containing dehydrogenase
MLGEAVRDLRGRTRGEVLEPGAEGYEAARAAYNAMATGRPVAIIRPADLPDIVAAVSWAAESGLPIGVRGGGHSVAGHSSPNGALLIDLSRWRGATIDPIARTADALAGSRLMISMRRRLRTVWPRHPEPSSTRASAA